MPAAVQLLLCLHGEQWLIYKSFCVRRIFAFKKGRHFAHATCSGRTYDGFYESPVRLIKTLQDFIKYFGAERNCSVSRELNKDV